MLIKKEIAKKILDTLLIIITTLSLILFFTILGFEIQDNLISIIDYLLHIIIILFILQELIRWFIIRDKKSYLKQRWFENIVALFLLINLFIPEIKIIHLIKLIPYINEKTATLLYLGFIHFLIIFVVLVKILRYTHLISNLKLPPGAIFTISFAIIIMFGTTLLLLPNATISSKPISFIDALFTSTSAVCVTGLVVLDTAKDFTLLGQFIILFLIQVGGLGVMTFTTFFALFLSGTISFKYRILMKDFLSQENISEVKTLLLKIISFTFTIELFGAMFLYISSGGTLTKFDLYSFYESLFHSVSAFCNAGFSIFTAGMTNPLYVNNYIYHTIIMLLIITGGLGFTTLTNISQIRPWKKYIRLRHRLNLNSKIILSSTIILILGGTLLITFFEPYFFDRSLSFGEKLFHSLYLSVTSRTAGFNIAPMAALTPVTITILLPLMWIGASPGGTGGGIKTTTISLAVLTLYNLMRGKDKVELFGREISLDSIRKAFMVIFSSLIFLCISTIILIWSEPDKAPLNLIFEAVSAIGTVGLSIDITPHLGTGGKVIIIFLMFIGRIGVLTFFLSFVKLGKPLKYNLPKSNIVVG